MSLRYTRQYATETLLLHWGSTALSVALVVVVDRLVAAAPVQPRAAAAWIVLMVINASLTTLLAARAVRQGHDLDESDIWDNATTLILLGLLAGLVSASGGLLGATWLLAFPALVYYGGIVVTAWARVTAVGYCFALTLAVAWAGTLTADTAPLLLAAVVTLFWATASTQNLSRTVYEAHEEAEERRSALSGGVTQLSAVLKAAADGDLTVRAHEVAGSQELTSLAESLGGAVRSLQQLVVSVSDGGHELSSSVGRLLETAREHAAGAGEQSSAVEETNAILAELAGTATQIAATAELVAEFAVTTLRHAEDGRTAVAASVGAMEDIAEHVESVAQRSELLAESGRQIGQILQVIDELSDRTNLLALNAAIEAARAGEHGRGFAVVAGEVRRLAERAQEATSQIQEIVARIQSETAAALAAGTAGAREVHAGVDLARAAERALDRIADTADQTTTAAREISIATQQQRNASDQVVVAMTQVAAAARQAESGSRDSEDAARRLAEIADSLEESIAKFRVDARV